MVALARGDSSYQSLLQTLEEECKESLSDSARAILKEAIEGYRGLFRESRLLDYHIPFIMHPVGTARLAIRYFPVAENITDDLDTVICVALAHDLLEDTRIEASRIEAAAGPEVRSYVEALTKLPAEVAGMSAEERNLELLDRIVAAGTTAVFVKICDSMHNLSTPGTTPLALLNKLARKAERQYLSLLERCPLGREFEEIYRGFISAAEDRVAKDSEHIEPGPPPENLESAIAECIAASTGKVLEFHDIVAILNRICRTENITVWRYSVGGEELLTQVLGPQPKDNQVQLRAADFCESPRVFDSQDLYGLSTALSDQIYSTFFTIPLQTDPETILVLVLGFDSEGPPAWLTVNSATVLLVFLAHRLIISEADRRERLARAAMDRGIQTLDNYLAAGESNSLEYKSSLRWDMNKKHISTELQKVIAKSIAGFLNTDGGVLLIGVSDDGSICGIEQDLKTLSRKDRNLDGFEQLLVQVVTNYLGTEFCKYVHSRFEEKAGKTVCVVEVEGSPKPVFLSDKGAKEFCVRAGNTTRSLDVEAAHEYILMQWKV